MILRAIAIDDEPLALEVLKKFAGKIPSLELVQTFQNPIAAVEFLQQETIDLMFLDIQMPDLTGIQLLQSMGQKPMIIFTTAHPEHAVMSYELNAIDYLLKPIGFDRFFKAVNKALTHKKAHLALEAKEIPNVVEPHPAHPNSDFIFVKSDTRFFKVNLSDIRYIEGMRDYIAVHTSSQRILTLMNMGQMLEKLPSTDFMRIHKSYIIGLNHITLIQQNRVLIGDREIPISNSYKETFLKFVEERQK